MSESKPVTLKRSVAIKAIVTEKFKEYMRFEVQNAITTSSKRIDELQKKMQEIGRQLADKGDGNKLLPSYQQIETEIYQLESSVADLKKREASIVDLKMGSHFMQGLIDGFVQIKKGDNLYEKLGGLEILVEDGVVQDIKSVGDAVPSNIG
ncbi:hypothetical protein HOG98_01040 [bacterium]|jgi:hypothetical protein|nr:hypothetical protein [bacterium]